MLPDVIQPATQVGAFLPPVRLTTLMAISCGSDVVPVGLDEKVAAVPVAPAVRPMVVWVVRTMRSPAWTARDTALMLPDRLRGNGFGVLGLVQSIGDLGATLVVGILWAAVSPPLPSATQRPGWPPPSSLPVSSARPGPPTSKEKHCDPPCLIRDRQPARYRDPRLARTTDPGRHRRTRRRYDGTGRRTLRRVDWIRRGGGVTRRRSAAVRRSGRDRCRWQRQRPDRTSPDGTTPARSARNRPCTHRSRRHREQVPPRRQRHHRRLDGCSTCHRDVCRHTAVATP